MSKEYYVEFEVTGSCGVTVIANSKEDAKKKVDYDKVKLNEWAIGEMVGVTEE